ncbi:MAG: D-2-hydroxyacid dehydrogenase [Pedosphaera sp.]|nr:D-2-hydroxyacid dehydrogenase [Pedosphaera sp.]
MRIVILDGQTLNPGDLDWTPLQALGDCVIFPRTKPSEVVVRADGAEIVITNKAIISREQILALPALRYIGVTATGINIVDVATAEERGIVVSNVPAYGTRSVAQHTMALLLELTQHAGFHAQGVREGRWVSSADWSYWEHSLVELDGLSIGIVGHGRIGAVVGALAAAFGMRVVATPPRDGRALPHSVTALTLDELFSISDVVSLHCPLTPATRHLVNASRLARMKSGAFLINTARGPLVDEAALAEALNAGRLAGAALDVLSTEPPAADNPLLTARNCIVTPHLAWATQAARARLLAVVVSNLRAFLAGTPQNRVNENASR